MAATSRACCAELRRRAACGTRRSRCRRQYRESPCLDCKYLHTDNHTISEHKIKETTSLNKFRKEKEGGENDKDEEKNKRHTLRVKMRLHRTQQRNTLLVLISAHKPSVIAMTGYVYGGGGVSNHIALII